MEKIKIFTQGFSQDLETGCPKLATVKFVGSLILRETTIYSDYNHKHIFSYRNEGKIHYYNVLGITLSLKSFNYMLEIDISRKRNYSQKYLGVLRGDI